MPIGALKTAEASLRRRIDLCREIEEEEQEGTGHYELGRVLAYLGRWSESAQEFDAGEAIKKRTGHIQAQSVIWAYRALRALLMARDKTSEVSETSEVYATALSTARRALELADEDARTTYPVERDYVRAHWLLGAAQRLNGEPAEAERHLSEALTRCRNINAVDGEADILLDLARLRADQDLTPDPSPTRRGESAREDALRLAGEARIITERSGYVLQGADVHLFLAQMALKDGNKAEELTHAREARRLATCDGPPDYTYKVAYDEAGALLGELGDSLDADQRG
jgi:tetratricopeptide (TPR) repeat protein